MLGVCSFMRGKPESEITPHMKKVSLFARENLGLKRERERRGKRGGEEKEERRKERRERKKGKK